MSIKSFLLYDHQAHLSDLDWFAISRTGATAATNRDSSNDDDDDCNNGKKRSDAYRRATIKLLASDFLTWGMPEIIDVVVWIVRVWFCWVHVSVIIGGGGLAATHMSSSPTPPLVGTDVSEWVNAVLRFLAPHLWWAVGRLL